MGFYEHNRRLNLKTVDDVDEEIDAIKRKLRSEYNPAVIRDLEIKLEVCGRIRSDLQQTELFPLTTA